MINDKLKRILLSVLIAILIVTIVIIVIYFVIIKPRKTDKFRRRKENFMKNNEDTEDAIESFVSGYLNAESY